MRQQRETAEQEKSKTGKKNVLKKVSVKKANIYKRLNHIKADI